MATLEKNTLLSAKDANNLILLFPTTKVENVIGLDAATTETAGLLSPADKIKIDKLPGVDQSYAVIQRDAGGVYVDI